MADNARILVLAATSRELAPPDGFLGALCGVGPVEAAVNSARAITIHQPFAVLHVGIAGARRASDIRPGTLVIGSASRYSDLGDLPAEWAPRELLAPAWLVHAAQAALPEAITVPIGTSARVGGTTGSEVEAMEGFGVLRAAQAAGIPALEVRAISNEIEEPDRARWEFARAFDAITAATPQLVRALVGAAEASHQATRHTIRSHA